ncbi:MAG: hypothetical protein ACLFMO_04260 [Eubacteriales bacterium]
MRVQRRKRKKFKIITRKLLLFLFIYFFLFTDFLYFNCWDLGKNTINWFASSDEPSSYTLVTVHRDTIYINERESTQEILENRLNRMDKNSVIIHLVNNTAYENVFLEIQERIHSKGYRTIVSEKIPVISYDHIYKGNKKKY